MVEMKILQNIYTEYILHKNNHEFIRMLFQAGRYFECNIYSYKRAAISLLNTVNYKQRELWLENEENSENGIFMNKANVKGCLLNLTLFMVRCLIFTEMD